MCSCVAQCPKAFPSNCETGRLMSRLSRVLFHQTKFFRRQCSWIFQHAVLDAIFPRVQAARRCAACPVLPGQPEFLPNQPRILRHAARVTARVSILFVDGRLQEFESSRLNSSRSLGASFSRSSILDVAGICEVFSQLADFTRPRFREERW